MSPGGLVSLPPDAPVDADGSGAQGAGAAVVGDTVTPAVVAGAVEPGAVEPGAVDDGADAPRVAEFDVQAAGRSVPTATHPTPSAMKPLAQREPDAGHARRIHASTKPTVRTAGF